MWQSAFSAVIRSASGLDLPENSFTSDAITADGT
jgi:hypothetical protein